jgi:hypothetical protein
MEPLATRLYWGEDGLGWEDVVTVAKPGWSPERHQAEHTRAFAARLHARYLALVQARYAERVDYAETADWGPPKGWPERPGMREYRKQKYLEFEAAKHAETLKALVSTCTPHKPRNLRRPLPGVVYRDRSEAVAAQYPDVVFERLED